MSALNPSWNGSFMPQVYVNSSVSNTITNTTTETAFDQFHTVQAGHAGILDKVFRFKAMGTISTALLNLGFTFRVRWGGTGTNGTVIGTSGGISLASSISDGGWAAEGVILIRNADTAGQGEFQGEARFQAGAITNIPLSMPNTSNFNIDNSVANNLYLTAQWNTASASNAIQLRSFILDTSRP